MTNLPSAPSKRKERKTTQKSHLDREDHEKIVEQDAFESVVEWSEQGDLFKKLSIFSDYTPIRTSSGTSI